MYVVDALQWSAKEEAKAMKTKAILSADAHVLPLQRSCSYEASMIWEKMTERQPGVKVKNAAEL